MTTTLAEGFRAQLLPAVERVIALAEEADAPEALAFFLPVKAQLEQAGSEEALLGLCMELSSLAFVLDTDALPPELLLAIDALLEGAQNLAFTMTAGDGGAPEH